jgi:hypothetical protein
MTAVSVESWPPCGASVGVSRRSAATKETAQ